MRLRRQCYAIGANLVRRVAIGSNSVCTDNYSVNALRAHCPRRHIISNQRYGNLILVELEGREPCSLQKRACFVSVNHLQLALRISAADNAQRRAPAAGRQCTCVAVRQHDSLVWQHLGAILAHAFIDGNIVCINLLCLRFKCLDNLEGRQVILIQLCCQLILQVRSPSQVYSRRTRRNQVCTHSVQRTKKVGLVGNLACAERHSEGCSCTDSRRTTHLQAFNRQLDAQIILAANPFNFIGQQGLVQKHQLALLPTHSFNHRAHLTA